MIFDSIKKMLFKPKGLVGLDIGSQSMKVAEVQASGKKFHLKSLCVLPTPSGVVNNGDILQPSTLSQAIQTGFKENKIKNKSIAANVWGAAVMVKKINMPVMDKKLLNEQIRWEAEQYIPFDINDISLEHHVIERTESNPDIMEVLLIAAKRDLIANYTTSIQGAGLDCEILDVSNFALANCFEMNYGKLSQCVAILNIGSRVTNFVAIQNGEVVFCRDIMVGGFNYTNDIHKELGVSLSEAEALKLTALTGQNTPEEVQSIISSTNESIAEEIQNSIDFYLAASSDLPLEKIFLTGGTVLMPGLVEFLSSFLNLPQEELDPFLQLDCDPKKFSSDFLNQMKPFSAIALGLALRKAGDA